MVTQLPGTDFYVRSYLHDLREMEPHPLSSLHNSSVLCKLKTTTRKRGADLVYNQAMTLYHALCGNKSGTADINHKWQALDDSKHRSASHETTAVELAPVPAACPTLLALGS